MREARGRGEDFCTEATRALQAHDCPCTVAASGGQLGVFASREIRAGERICSERPLTLTVAHEFRPSVCAVCLRNCRDAGGGRWACGGCGMLRFCSGQCEAAAAQRHHTECAALTAVHEALAADTKALEVAAQIISILCDRSAERRLDVGAAGEHGFESYQGRLVKTTPPSAEDRRVNKRAAAAVREAMPSEMMLPDAQLTDLVLRHQCNLYGVSGPGGDTIAHASFVGFFHLFNHACCPNIMFDSAGRKGPAGATPEFDLIAMCNMAPGTELCYSYCCTFWNASERIEYLRTHYAFDCACRRCACPEYDLEWSEEIEDTCCVADETCGQGLGIIVEPGRDLRRCVLCSAEWT